MIFHISFFIFFVVFFLLANFMESSCILTVHSKSFIAFNYHARKKTKAVLESWIQRLQTSATKFLIFNLKIFFFTKVLYYLFFNFFTLIFHLCVSFTQKWNRKSNIWMRTIEGIEFSFPKLSLFFFPSMKIEWDEAFWIMKKKNFTGEAKNWKITSKLSIFVIVFFFIAKMVLSIN